MNKSQMESSEPFPTSRRGVDPAKSRAEAELFDARRTVRDLAVKIEEANSRARQKVPKSRERGEQKTSSKNEEDTRYAQVMKEMEHMKQEFSKLKLDMEKVLSEKRRAEKEFKASSSIMYALSSSVARIEKEIEGIDEEQVIAELARIEAVKEREAIEAQRIEEANRYKTQLENVKKKVESIVQNNEMTKELQITLYNVNLLENELKQTKNSDRTPTLLIMEELEAAKMELATVRREGFNFMASMDVIRNELKRVQEEKAQFEKEESKWDLTVQNLKSKISRGKAKLEAVSVSTEKSNTIASNLSVTIEQLRAESETAKKENEIISKELQNINMEIPKTESEIELTEKQLEAAMEELKLVKLSEIKALENLRKAINSTVRDQESDSMNNSTIKITDFEYEYITRKAGEAEEIADKKVAAAQAWVEALKANEKEISMKIEIAQSELKDSSFETEERADRPVGRRCSINGELPRWAANDGKAPASPRKSMYSNRIGNMTPGKRGRSHNLLSPATRFAIKSASFTKKREKVMQI